MAKPNQNKIIKWTAIVLSALVVLGGLIKFSFHYDRGLDIKFVTRELYNLQVEVIKEDIKDIKTQQQEDSGKLDRVLILLEDE
jgi:hypothetical protein